MVVKTPDAFSLDLTEDPVDLRVEIELLFLFPFPPALMRFCPLPGQPGLQ